MNDKNKDSSGFWSAIKKWAKSGWDKPIDHTVDGEPLNRRDALLAGGIIGILTLFTFIGNQANRFVDWDKLKQPKPEPEPEQKIAPPEPEKKIDYQIIKQHDIGELPAPTYRVPEEYAPGITIWIYQSPNIDEIRTMGAGRYDDFREKIAGVGDKIIVSISPDISLEREKSYHPTGRFFTSKKFLADALEKSEFKIHVYYKEDFATTLAIEVSNITILMPLNSTINFSALDLMALLPFVKATH